MKRVFLLISFVCYSFLTFAALRLPNLFGDHMVLQRNKPIVIWGWADRNESVVVQFAGQVAKTKADQYGKWKVSLKSMSAGGPYSLSIKANEEIVLKDVLIGEVWLCSGQSNMEFQLKDAKNGQAEISKANHSQIRQIVVPKAVADQPKDDMGSASWQIADPQHAGQFTAVGYFFAVELYKKLKIPIGLINSSWGGTNVETWTSTRAFQESHEFASLIPAGYRLNLDSIARQRRASTNARIQKLQGKLSAKAEVDLWKDSAFEDQGWPVMQLPGVWEEQALSNFDGVVWLRKVIYLDEATASKPAVLHLAKIDDSDEAYINGIKVGGLFNQYNINRIYPVNAGILKPGKNVIAIRVEDTGGNGGLYGNDLFELRSGQDIIKLNGLWKFQVQSIFQTNSFQNPNTHPSLLFNGMIHPLIDFGIAGAIWYQGESNAGRAYQYRKSFPLMIQDWRKHWGLGDFPFYFIQLSSFDANGGNSDNGSAWSELREAQRMTLSMPATGMAVTTDVGDAKDIHPRNKKTVGERLAAIALKKTYRQPVSYTGPNYRSMKVQGNQIVLSFDREGGRLTTGNNLGELNGFEIAGENKRFYKAKAYVKGNQVLVSSDQVLDPVAVRYAWADDAGQANLFNREGFPASPFRTDSWKGVTENEKYFYSISLP